MTQADPVDVLICGAGAAGLTLALDLARRGISFRLVEKRDAPFHGSRGKGIQPRTLEILEDFGLLDRVAAKGGFYPVLRDHRPEGGHVDRDIIGDADPSPGEPYRAPLLVAQFLTELVLREGLAELGHAPVFGCALTGFAQDDSGVSAHLVDANGAHTLRARYLVGADGGRSTVREALAIGFPGETLGVRAIAADVMLDGLGRDAWHRFNESSMDRQIAFCPLVGTEMMQIQGPVPSEGDVDLSAAGLTEMIAARTGRGDIHVRSVSWASAYTMHARLADRYRVGRVFLAGDAAHVHPPTGGQGLNTSMQDSYNLGWKLAAALRGAPDALLDSYEGERRLVASAMLGLSTRLLDAAKRGDLRRGRDVRQLDLGYRESPLALRGGRAVRVCCAPEIARPMPRSGAQAASRRACSRCSPVRTGRCWAGTSRGAARFRRVRACGFMPSGPAGTSRTSGGMSGRPMP